MDRSVYSQDTGYASRCVKALSATPASLLPDINVVWDESESPIPVNDPTSSLTVMTSPKLDTRTFVESIQSVLLIKLSHE